jgi:hypothetical protein
MALPLNGQISIGMIRTELGIPNQSPFSLNTSVLQNYVTLNQFSPYLPSEARLSSWRGYDHTSGGGGLPSGSYELYLAWGETKASSCIGLVYTYYTDGVTLDESTVLYTVYGQTDPSYLAQAGWYSDGLFSIYWDGSGFVGVLSLCRRPSFVLYDNCFFGQKLGSFYLENDDFSTSNYIYTDDELRKVYNYQGIVSDNTYYRNYDSKGLGELNNC